MSGELGEEESAQVQPRVRSILESLNKQERKRKSAPREVGGKKSNSVMKSVPGVLGVRGGK